MKSTICIAEDRLACEPCLRLLLLSLAAHSPSARISLFFPAADGRFVEWVGRFATVDLRRLELQQGIGWNVKPQAMLALLDAGFDEVIWIDSDVLVTADISPVISQRDRHTFVATEHPLGKERHDVDAARARLWGLSVGRRLPAAVNSGVLRATTEHRRLLERWRKLLQSPDYQASQKKPWDERPIHMLGDQDVLTALLTSSEFAATPLHILERGRHIIQFDGVWGYSVRERLTNLAGTGPVFVHSIAGKPWTEPWAGPTSTRRDYLKLLYLDLSPYTMAAVRYRQQLGLDAAWMQPHDTAASVLRALGLGGLPLTGLPMAFVADMVRAIGGVRNALTGRRTSAAVLPGNGGSGVQKTHALL
jgi:hypothetical protein